MAAAAAAPRRHRRSRIHPTNGSSSVLLMSAATYVDWVGAATQQPSRGTEPDQFRRDIVVPSVRLYVGMSWVCKRRRVNGGVFCLKACSQLTN